MIPRMNAQQELGGDGARLDVSLLGSQMKRGALVLTDPTACYDSLVTVSVTTYLPSSS